MILSPPTVKTLLLLLLAFPENRLRIFLLSLICKKKSLGVCANLIRFMKAQFRSILFTHKPRISLGFFECVWSCNMFSSVGISVLYILIPGSRFVQCLAYRICRRQRVGFYRSISLIFAVRRAETTAFPVASGEIYILTNAKNVLQICSV